MPYNMVTPFGTTPGLVTPAESMSNENAYRNAALGGQLYGLGLNAQIAQQGMQNQQVLQQMANQGRLQALGLEGTNAANVANINVGPAMGRLGMEQQAFGTQLPLMQARANAQLSALNQFNGLLGVGGGGGGDGGSQAPSAAAGAPAAPAATAGAAPAASGAPVGAGSPAGGGAFDPLSAPMSQWEKMGMLGALANGGAMPDVMGNRLKLFEAQRGIAQQVVAPQIDALKKQGRYEEATQLAKQNNIPFSTSTDELLSMPDVQLDLQQLQRFASQAQGLGSSSAIAAPIQQAVAAITTKAAQRGADPTAVRSMLLQRLGAPGGQLDMRTSSVGQFLDRLESPGLGAARDALGLPSAPTGLF